MCNPRLAWRRLLIAAHCARRVEFAPATAHGSISHRNTAFVLVSSAHTAPDTLHSATLLHRLVARVFPFSKLRPECLAEMAIRYFARRLFARSLSPGLHAKMGLLRR